MVRATSARSSAPRRRQEGLTHVAPSRGLDTRILHRAASPGATFLSPAVSAAVPVHALNLHRNDTIKTRGLLKQVGGKLGLQQWVRHLASLGPRACISELKAVVGLASLWSWSGGWRHVECSRGPTESWPSLPPARITTLI